MLWTKNLLPLGESICFFYIKSPVVKNRLVESEGADMKTDNVFKRAHTASFANPPVDFFAPL